MKEKCKFCGKTIPEGNQVCIICGRGKPKKQTNYDRIRNMSVEEMAKIIPKFLMAHLNKYGKALGLDEVIPTKDEMKETEKEWKKWLESEVDAE